MIGKRRKYHAAAGYSHYRVSHDFYLLLDFRLESQNE